MVVTVTRGHAKERTSKKSRLKSARKIPGVRGLPERGRSVCLRALLHKRTLAPLSDTSIALPAVAFLLRSAKGAQHVADMALLHKRVGDHV